MTLGGRKITRESAYGEKIIFFPKSDGEAEYLQKRLLEEGFLWQDGDRSICELEATRQRGLVIIKNLMAIPGPDDTGRYEVCPVSQVDAGRVTAEPDRILEMFTKIAERLDSLDRRVAAIEAELAPPATLDKGKLTKPPANGGPAGAP
jgi:hypothetical protein